MVGPFFYFVHFLTLFFQLLDGQSGNVTEFIPFLKQSLDYAAHFAFNEAFSGTVRKTGLKLSAVVIPSCIFRTSV